MSQGSVSRRAIVTLGMAAFATATIGTGVAAHAQAASKARQSASSCTIGGWTVGYYDLNGDEHDVATTPDIQTWCP